MTITPTATDSTGNQHDGKGTPVHPDPTLGLPFSPMAASDSSQPKPARRTAPRKNTNLFPAESPAQHHALYRLFNADGVLLYVGETNNPVERYVEHRDTKEWWPEVASHSIYWSTKGREAVQELEKEAIRDEWPIYNIAHQPRGDGTYFVPSYVVEKILEKVKWAVCEIIGDAVPQDGEDIAHLVENAFKPQDDEEAGECGWGEIGFPFGGGGRPEALDLDAVLDAMGLFRPDIDNSMRDPKPRRRKGKRCEGIVARRKRGGECAETLRRDDSCPRPERHLEDAPSLTDPLDAVDGA